MNFSLKKNPLYAKEGDPLYVAQCRSGGRMTKDQVIQRLAHGSTLTEADVNAVLSGLEKVLVEYVARGLRIDLGFLSLTTSIKGGFDSDEDSFRKERNRIKINSNVTHAFATAVNLAAKPVRVPATRRAPNPMKIVKMLGNMNVREFQAGNLVRITGSKLTFDNTDTEVGVFLKPQSGPEIRIKEYAKTSAVSILCVLPEKVKPGKHKLEVRSRSNDGEINAGILEDTLIFAA